MMGLTGKTGERIKLGSIDNRTWRFI